MKPNQVRIIGGKWRGRKIIFPNQEGLRPTPDRIRETLFNWLSSHIQDARCLDLFAGSGVLGFEALSRGATSVVCLEKNPLAITALKKNRELLKASSLEIIERNGLLWLKENSSPFDIVFLDPPYHENLLPSTFALLESHGWLRPSSLIYFESNTIVLSDELPNAWQLLKEKKAGNVYYYLAQKR